jgi:hypothetical protein
MKDKPLKDCTCLGTCRGADGLGAGWQCALKSPSPMRERPEWLESRAKLVEQIAGLSARCTALEQEKAGLMSTLKGAGDATTEWMQRCTAVE